MFWKKGRLREVLALGGSPIFVVDVVVVSEKSTG